MRRIFLVIFLSGLLFAEVDPKMFGGALENYLTGKYESAYKDSKMLFKKNPADKKVCDLHHKILVKMALLYEKRKDFRGALNFINEAEKIKRTSQTSQIKERLLKKLKTTKKTNQTLKKGKTKKIVTPTKKSKKKAKKKAVKAEKAKPTKGKKVKKIEGKVRVEWPKTVLVISILNLLGLVVLTYFVVLAFTKRKDEKLLDEERRISQIVQTLGSKAEYQTILQNQKEILEELNSRGNRDDETSECRNYAFD